MVGTIEPADKPDMGLQQAQTALSADMASVRTGDRGPTGQELEAFRIADASVRLRLGQWESFKHQSLAQWNSAFQTAGIKEAQ